MKYLMTFSYDGSKYKGYQKQPKQDTIQGKIEEVLKKINSNKKVSITATGRTDASVHAINQKAHFELNNKFDCEKLRYSVNSLLPDDIYVKKIEIVPESFHARFDVKSKEYIYKINVGEYNPIEKDYVLQYNKKLDLIEIERALKYIEGEHNFRAFTKVDDEKDDYVRTIFSAKLIKDTKEMDHIVISLVGSGFLRYMVRNIVGTLLEIGEGKKKSEDIIKILSSCDRRKAGICASPVGLYLKDINY